MRYSIEEERFLIEHIDSVSSYKELTDMMNQKFGTARLPERVREKCNKGLHISTGKNVTQYGNKPKERIPIGSIRKSSNGSTYIKVADNDIKYTGYQEPWWIPLQKKIYEDAYGPIPDGYMVCFLNCDRDDFRLENLYPITRKTSARLAKNGWWSEFPEITMTAIKLCEYEEAVKSI